MRTIRIVLALVTLLISASPARAALEQSRTVHMPAGLADLEDQLQDAHFARIGVDGHPMVLVKPRVTPVGLAYESLRGFPQSRPAIVVGAGWDSIPVRPNPVPWDDIDQIERGTRSRALGAVIGGVVGLVGGFYLGAWSGDSRSPDYAWAIGPAIFAVGAGLGALLFSTTKWKQVYPEPEDSARR